MRAVDMWLRRAVIAALLGFGLAAYCRDVGLAASSDATGWSESVLYAFTGGADGSSPQGPLLADPHGGLYGSANVGGSNRFGTVFLLNSPAAGKSAWSISVLHTFMGSDGAVPNGGLVADTRGVLYGTTLEGGTDNGGAPAFGTVFALTPPALRSTPWTLSVLHAFDPGQVGEHDGEVPVAGVIVDARGNLYGTTSGGGAFDCGVSFERLCGSAFRLAPPALGTASWLEITRSFKGATFGDGDSPSSGLIVDKLGSFFGTTTLGGAYGGGTAFAFSPQGHENVLYSFPAGAAPGGGVIADASGALYGTTASGGVFGWGSVFTLVPPARGQSAWTERTLYSFKNQSDGATPNGPLIADSGGALYGTTFGGGIRPNAVLKYGPGVVYKLVPPSAGRSAWTERVLHEFVGHGDGEHPNAGLIADGKGALYGTTSNGGAGNMGTVFRLIRTKQRTRGLRSSSPLYSDRFERHFDCPRTRVN